MTKYLLKQRDRQTDSIMTSQLFVQIIRIMGEEKHNAVQGLDKRLKAVMVTLTQGNRPSRLRHAYVKSMYYERSLMLVGTGMCNVMNAIYC